MTTATVLQFMQKTAEDEALRHQLEALLGVGDGNISSETELDAAETEALKGDLAPIVAEFAAQNGFAFSATELVTVIDAFQQHRSGQLSDAAFASLVGVSAGKAESITAVNSPIGRLSRYLKKTYLGISGPQA